MKDDIKQEDVKQDDVKQETFVTKGIATFKQVVVFVKRSISEGLLVTAKEDKQSAGIVVGILVALFVLPIIFGGSDSADGARDTSNTGSSYTSGNSQSGTSIEQYESDSMDLERPFGVFSFRGLLGNDTYFDFSNKRLSSFDYIDGIRVVYFDVEINRLGRTTELDLRKTGMKDIKEGITFQFKDPNQRAVYNVTIITKTDGRTVMLRYLDGKGIRSSIVSTITYIK